MRGLLKTVSAGAATPGRDGVVQCMQSPDRDLHSVRPGTPLPRPHRRPVAMPLMRLYTSAMFGLRPVRPCRGAVGDRAGVRHLLSA